MPKVALLATGGTIASRGHAGGGARAADTGADLLGRVAAPGDLQVVSRDVMRLNSFAMGPRDMQILLDAVVESLGGGDVDGVVVTHGTDTMEETSFLVDLFLHDERPVVFTGAQRGADSPDSDGPANLRDALTVAAAGISRRLGTLIVFDGAIFAARGTRKSHTLNSSAFSAPDTGQVGGVARGTPWFSARPRRDLPVLDPARLRIDGLRVDIVAGYPGSDGAALDAAVAAGARGIVLEATGAGNANPVVCDTIARLTGQGVVVLLSTRVFAGPVVPLYGGGGGTDLVAAGAIPTGRLRPGQARMLLIGLLGTGADADAVRAALALC